MAQDRWLWIPFVALGLGLGGLVVRGQSRGSDPVVEAAFEAAQELQAAEQVDAALDKYREVLALDPDHVPALYHSGWSYYAQSRWDDVVRSWERVLALDPTHAEAARYLPEARTSQERMRQARAGKDAAPVPTPTALADVSGSPELELDETAMQALVQAQPGAEIGDADAQSNTGPAGDPSAPAPVETPSE